VRIFSVDPGPVQSGWLLCEAAPFRIVDMGITPNDDVRARCSKGGFDVLVIEHISMGGMIAGQETFDTCFEAGRFAEAARPRPFVLLKRIKVKLHLCGQARAKDSNIRQALVDRFGGSAAIGKKASKGPLYGVKAHIWAALAIAVTYADTTSAATVVPDAPSWEESSDALKAHP
jgi:hypothetical protein